jgi:hypothetical protein
MVGNDERNIACELAAAMAVKQVDEAVIIPGNENHHFRPVA